MSDQTVDSAATIFRSQFRQHPAAKPSPHEVLVEQLAREMRRRWQRRENPLAEEFLNRHPELWLEPLAAIEVIYEEIHLREEQGAKDAWSVLFARFPQWRDHLEALQECHQALDAPTSTPHFPEVGESLGEYRLVAELGRGLQGRVFLAKQPALADRPVVLKLTPRTGLEHLSLARLQHTNIVPLFTARDDRARQLRLLCMPYFGGATVFEVVRHLANEPLEHRTGRSLMDAVDHVQSSRPAATSGLSGPRAFLTRASYVQSVCWIGACCADALHYAHERNLLHLDLKPSNVLIAADGQPMLLDFHLAREPIRAEGPPPEGLGGTPAYMAPEQYALVEAIARGKPIAVPVDARADVYSLGTLLYEALGGSSPFKPGTSPPLHRVNSQVSVGLSDLIGRCLEQRPADRYPDAAALAADLRRHLSDRPLAGVRNRSWPERWRKWRRRRSGLFRSLAALSLTAVVAVAFGVNSWLGAKEKVAEAKTALADGMRQARDLGHLDEAEATLRRGLTALRHVPFQRSLANQLQAELDKVDAAHEAAQRERLARELHKQTEQMRVLFGLEIQPSQHLGSLLAHCRELWSRREQVPKALSPELAAVAKADLGDLAILWTDLSVRLAPPADTAAARREALQVLDDARTLLGGSPVLDLLQKQNRLALGLPEKAPQSGSTRPAQTAWEHYALGRAWLRSGDLERASAELHEAVVLEPDGCWPNYYYGLCAWRLNRWEDAALAFSVCVGAAPKVAGFYYNRALALGELRRDSAAMLDYGRALELDPTMSAAALNRGMLQYRGKRYGEATRDLEKAAQLGADPATVSYDLALINLAQENRDAAKVNLRRALEYFPAHREAQALLDQIEKKKQRP
jgi:serine/threonine protein kinase/tetratricopeptide (TPR) repeat protein